MCLFLPGKEPKGIEIAIDVSYIDYIMRDRRGTVEKCIFALVFKLEECIAICRVYYGKEAPDANHHYSWNHRNSSKDTPVAKAMLPNVSTCGGVKGGPASFQKISR